jgi:hypothetical protein
VSDSNVELWIYHRATHAESIEQRHAVFVASMSYVGSPLGFAGMKLLRAPECGSELCAVFHVKYPTPGLWLDGEYIYRGQRYRFRDRHAYDDKLRIGFKTSNKALDYRAILHEHLPRVVEAFGAYRAKARFGLYGLRYQGGLKDTNPVYNRLRADKAIDVDGRNNIYTLEPAQYWDSELCRRALGCGPEGVARACRATRSKSNR